MVDLASTQNDVGVIEVFPNSPAFLGENPSFNGVKDRRLFRFSKKLPDLTEFRADLNDDSGKDITKGQRLRKELTHLVGKFPNVPDLHALKAIQAYKDLQQSGVSDQKFQTIESIVITLGRAINTHAYSLNNLLWFLKIFIHYLELLKKRLLSGYEIVGVKYSEAKRQIAVLHQQASKSKKELDFLYTKYERTSFFSEGITVDEVVQAYDAMKKGREKLPIGQLNRPAKVIHLLHFKINMMLSRVPLFAPIVEQNLSMTGKIVHRDVYLMNGMITISRMLNEYYLILARGDLEAQKVFLIELNKKCRENISYLQENQTLNKEYEFDPLLKQAVIALEMVKFPFSPQVKQTGLNQARIGLFKIINRCENQNAIHLANRYALDIEGYLGEYGEEAS